MIGKSGQPLKTGLTKPQAVCDEQSAAFYCYNKAMVFLNYRGEPLTAARLFEAAADKYRALCLTSSTEHRVDFYWAALFHAAYAARRTDDDGLYRHQMLRLFDLHPRECGQAPAQFSNRFGELLRT